MEALALVAKASSRHSLFKGVTLYKPTSKWRAQISHGGRTVTLGDYGTEEEAARVFDRACICKYGKDAACNFPLEYYKAEWDFLQASTIPALLLKFKEERQRSKGLRAGRAAQEPSASGSPVLESGRTFPEQIRSQARQQGDAGRSVMPSPASGLQSRDAAEGSQAGVPSAAGSAEAIMVKLERPLEQPFPVGSIPDGRGHDRSWERRSDVMAALQHLLPAYADTRASPSNAAVLCRSLSLADNTNPGLPFSNTSSNILPDHLEPHKLGPWLQHASRAVHEHPSDMLASDESEQAWNGASADEAAMPGSMIHVARQCAGRPRAGSDVDRLQRVSDGSSAGPSSRANLPSMVETAQRRIQAVDDRPVQAPTPTVPWPVPVGVAAAAANHAMRVRNGSSIAPPEYLSEANPRLASLWAALGPRAPPLQLPSRQPAPKRSAAQQTTDHRCADDTSELSGMEPAHDFTPLNGNPDQGMDLVLAARAIGAAAGAGAPYHPSLRTSYRPTSDWPQPPNKRTRVINPDDGGQLNNVGRMQERGLEEQDLPPRPCASAAVAVSTCQAHSATAATHRAAAIIAATAALQKGVTPSFPGAALRQVAAVNADAAHQMPCGALDANTAASSPLAPAASSSAVHDRLDRDRATTVLRHLLLAALLRMEEEEQQLRLRQQQQQQDFLIRQVKEALGLRPLAGAGTLEVLAALQAQDGTGTVKHLALVGDECPAAAAGAADLWSQDPGLNRNSNSSNNSGRGLQVATEDAGADRQLGLGSAQDTFNQRPQLRASGGVAAPPRHISTRAPSSSSHGSPGLSSSAGGDAAGTAVPAATTEGRNAATAASTYEYTQTQWATASGAAVTSSGWHHLPLHLAAIHLAPFQSSMAGSGAAAGREILIAQKLLVPTGNDAAAAAGGQHMMPLLQLEAPASTAAAALAGAPTLRLALGGNDGTVPAVVAARRDRNSGVANVLDMPIVLRVPVQLNQPQMLRVLQLEEGQHPARPALGAFGGDGGSPLRRIQIVSDA